MGAKIQPDKLAGEDGCDLTGQNKLVSNVLFSWGGHCVFIISGFVLPRMIDGRLGRELLGIWDFGWSLVSYFQLVQAGIASAVNRYVARYRVVGDREGINRIVSSSFFILIVGAVLVLALSAGASVLLPKLFGERLAEHVREAQWVVFFLGASIAAQICCSCYGGVITGCHRWDLHNAIISGRHIVIVAAMITALLVGGGLAWLGAINLAGMTLAGIARILVAHRVFRGLEIRLRHVRRRAMRNVFKFGGKTLMPSVSKLLLNQTVNILIIAYLGPGTLALYMRPRSLLRHLDTLVHKMAVVLTPTTSSLQSTEDLTEIRKLLVKSVQYSLYLVLPVVLVLATFGDAVMGLWMGPGYASLIVPAILAVGFLSMLVQTPILTVLVGLNAHGKAGFAQLVAAVGVVALTFFCLKVLDGGVVGVALAVVIPMTALNLTYMPVLVCRRVGMKVRSYAWSVVSKPAIHILPFAVSLGVARILLGGSPLGLVLGGCVGSVVLGLIYWRWVLPFRMKIWFARQAVRVKRLVGFACVSNRAA